MTWRVAQSLLTLRDQINETFPGRNKASDGTIGDANHRNRNSDHNPWYGPGIVTAIDITHDPKNGVDIDRLTDELAASRDPRIKYIIANGLILDSRPQFNPWKWVKYNGPNPHTRHFHLSVMPNPSCDDTRPWDLPSLKKGSDRKKGVTLSHVQAYRGVSNLWQDATSPKTHAHKRLKGLRPVLGLDVMQSQLDKLVNMVAKQNGITAEEIASALREGLVADIVPILREVVGEAQADEVADRVISGIAERLND